MLRLQCPWLLVANIDYSDYLGRLAVGKVFHGNAQARQSLVRIDVEGKQQPLKVSKLQAYQGIEVQAVDHADAGDIILLAGIEDVEIGDTVCCADNPKALKRI